MDIFFQDPTDVPLPPAEVRFRALQAKPYPDGRRVRVEIEITPFQKRPSLELVITDPAGGRAAEADIIETMTPRLELTLHLRGVPTPGTHTLQAILFYAPPPSPEDTHLPERTVVDETDTRFTMTT